MPPGTRGARGALRASGPLLALGLLLAGPVGLGADPSPTLATTIRPTLGAGERPRLAIDPPSFWLSGGSTAPLSAVWVSVPPGCTLNDTWYRWSIAGSSAEGLLAPTNSSTANFTADAAPGGVTELSARSGAVEACGANATAVEAAATANVTIDAGPWVSEVRAGPNPAEPNSPVALNGTVAGGEPPYTLTVAWGANRSTVSRLALPGPFGVTALLPAGSYAPRVYVEDAAGAEATGDVVEPLEITTGFAAAVNASVLLAEVGVPVDFAPQFLNPPGNISLLEECSDAIPAPAVSGGDAFACRFERSGTANVSVVAVGAAWPYPEASATLAEAVAPPLTLLAASTTTAEVGVPSWIATTIVGGVPPYSLAWSIEGTGIGGARTFDHGGTVRLPVTPTLAGLELVQIRATDALGVVSANASAPLTVEPPVTADAAAASTIGPEPTAVAVSAAVVAGVAPFDWAIVPDLTSLNDSPLAGTLDQAGSLDWRGDVLGEGNLSIAVVVVDALGVVWATGLTVPLPAVLELSASVNDSSPTATIDLRILGGVAPFAVWANTSSGALANATYTTDGTFAVALGAVPDGPVTVEVRDRAGASASVSIEAPRWPPGGSPGAGVGLGADVGAVVAVGLGSTAVGVWAVRRRRVRPAPPPPDAVLVLHELISPGDGIDRGAVELLAEERGIPLETVRTTLDRLIAEGTVLAERGADGEEVLAWAWSP